MNNHPNRNRPRRVMRRESYLAVAKKLRYYADMLDANAEKSTPQQRRAVTLAVNNLSHLSRKLYDRHHHGRVRSIGEWHDEKT